MKFVNECVYTPDVVAEAIGAWWDRRLKADIWKFILGFILILAGSLLLQNYYLLLLELFPLTVILLYKRKGRQSVRNEMDRLKMVFREGPPVYHVEIGEDIHYKTPKSENRVLFSELLDVRETKNLIVLFLKGSQTLTLSKEGFREGTWTECMEYLKTRTAKKKRV